MLNKLAKNQYVKIMNSNGSDRIEYGVVLDEINNQYEVMSVGFENKNGHFLEYTTDTPDLVQTYNTSDTVFNEVKENEVRRKMNNWLDKNYKN
ncbi:MAG: hypothetical protein ACRDD7_18290 [Peptostreptococcaceae bacterium]